MNIIFIRFKIAFFFALIFNVIILDAQNFSRAEHLVGLEILEDNNGVAVADYDNDNDLDIFVVAKAKDDSNNPKTLSRLYRNDNDGSFTDVTEESGLTDLFGMSEGNSDFIGLDGFKYGASWGDYDNDGNPDLFLTYSEKFQLWHNIGNGTFDNVTVTAGFSEFNGCGNTGATWFDYNNDGFLDIYVSDWKECISNSLYQNNGDGTFTDITASSSIQGVGNFASFVGFPFDFNSDGYLDLLVSNDLNKENDLFIKNALGIFENQAPNYNLNTANDDMAISICDYNNDGFFDFFITAIDVNALHTNDGDNTFTENSAATGLGDTDWSWGTSFADFDLDGDEDLYVSTGYAIENTGYGPQANFYFENKINDVEASFIDKSIEFGIAEINISVEALDFDFDNDGDLDLFVTNSDSHSFFYENKILNFDDSETSLNWIKVKLEGTISNRDAIGTEVVVKTENRRLYRYYSGIGFLGQNLKPVHFGLSTDNQIVDITIKWPSGLVETHSGFDINSTIKFTEAQGFQVLNIQPSQKIYGCTDSNSCTYNPDATLDDGSCQYLQSFVITGNTNASFLSNETYYYPLNTGSTLNWNVVGGEIISGQNTDSITVNWGIEDHGIVSVVESDAECNSEEVRLNIQLSTNNLPENISIARLWNEVLLDAIRGDFARPTVHARNLFHTSVAMYDVWSTYDDVAQTYLIGKTVNGFTSEFNSFSPLESTEDSKKKAISFAMYRLLSHRFQNSPGQANAQAKFDLIMSSLGYDTENQDLNYETGDAAALGNFVAQTIIDYGLQDGSREATGYDNAYYAPVNEAYALDDDDNSPILDPNRWQPLGLETFIDQGGNIVGENIPPFLSPEWGNVFGFALKDEDKNIFQRNGNIFNVYHNPTVPPQLSLVENNVNSDAYKNGFAQVSVWQSHLDPNDGVMWDISPNILGNTDLSSLPIEFQDYNNYYNFFNGGTINVGHDLNPITGNPYEPNIVPRGDYTRVLAEFWADGPDSETPPGHWFTILNYVNDHPLLEKRFQGEGELLNDLEWDVKAYFILGAGMHDAAISAWSVKGWHDYIRPISAIRSMAERGQSTNTSLSNYHIGGLPLIDGFIEVVNSGDPLAGQSNENLGEIKLFTWKGHNFIQNVETDQAGVGWILAKDWYPYQRPTFVTPPFAGYVSGHSTFSRTAADLLTYMTGSEFFPGGLGEFKAKANEFLVFEKGPSVDVVLQWATYRDASDQTSLSRIWGGIHPPADDIPGRRIGEKVAIDVFSYAVPYFTSALSTENYELIPKIFPNPSKGEIFVTNINDNDIIKIFDIGGREIGFERGSKNTSNNHTSIKINVSEGVYFLKIKDKKTIPIILRK